MGHLNHPGIQIFSPNSDSAGGTCTSLGSQPVIKVSPILAHHHACFWANNHKGFWTKKSWSCWQLVFPHFIPTNWREPARFLVCSLVLQLGDDSAASVFVLTEDLQSIDQVPHAQYWKRLVWPEATSTLRTSGRSHFPRLKINKKCTMEWQLVVNGNCNPWMLLGLQGCSAVCARLCTLTPFIRNVMRT